MSSKPRKRRLLKVVAVLFILLIGLVFFAPMIASGPVGNTIATQVNGALRNAEVNVESASFGWFGEQTVSGFAIANTDDAAAPDVVNLNIVVKNSLIDLILGSSPITIEIDGAAHAIVYEDGTTNLEKILPLPSEDDDEDEDKGAGGGVPDLDLKITSLDVTLEDRRSNIPVSFDGATMHITMARGGDLVATLNAKPGAGASHGAINADVRINAFLDDAGTTSFALDRVVGTVSAKDLPTSLFEPFLGELPIDLRRDLGPTMTVDALLNANDSGQATLTASSAQLNTTITGAFDPDTGDLTFQPSTVAFNARKEMLSELTGTTFVNDITPINLNIASAHIPGGTFDVGAIGINATVDIPASVSIRLTDDIASTIPLTNTTVSVNTNAINDGIDINGSSSIESSMFTIEQRVSGILPDESSTILQTLRADGTIAWNNISAGFLAQLLAPLPDDVDPMIAAIIHDEPTDITITTSTTADDQLQAILATQLGDTVVDATTIIDNGAFLVPNAQVSATLTQDILATIPAMAELATLDQPAEIVAALRSPMRIAPTDDGMAMSFDDNDPAQPHIGVTSSTPFAATLAAGPTVGVNTLDMGARLDMTASTIAPTGTMAVNVTKDSINAMLVPSLPTESDDDPEADDADDAQPLLAPKPMLQFEDDLQATVNLTDALFFFGDAETTTPAKQRLGATLALQRTVLSTASGKRFAVRKPTAEISSNDLASGMTIGVNAGFPKDGALALQTTITPPAESGPGNDDENSEDADAPGPTFDTSMTLTNMPTEFVDAIAQMNNVLVAALGPTVSGSLTTKNFSTQSGSLNGSLTTAQGSLNVAARGRNNTLRVTEANGVNASLELTEAFRSELLAGIHPIFKDIKSTDGPMTLTMSNARIPLDGDLKKLNADLQINVGRAMFDTGSTLFTALLLSKQPGVDQIEGNIDPINVNIKKGVVNYDRFNMQIGDLAFAYQGTINLNTKKINLTTDVPLGAIVNVFGNVAETEGTVVPLVIKGTINNPKQGVSPEFDLPALLLQLNLSDKTEGLSNLLNIFDDDE